MDQIFTLVPVGIEACDEDDGRDYSSLMTRRAVRDLVAGLLPDTATPAAFSDDDVLADIGLTSLGMIGLLLALETRFDLEVPRSEITSAVFQSVATVDALVGRLQARAETGAGFSLASVGRAGPHAPGVARHAAG